MIQDTGNLLADEVARKIKKKIEFQEYKQGERLTVRKLCDEFNVSETPVKQALNQLLTSGLVVSLPKRGMRVREFTLQDIKEIMEARMMIESYCVKDVINRIQKDIDFDMLWRNSVNQLRDVYQKCIDDFSRVNFNKAVDCDRNYHDLIVSCSENHQIIYMYSTLNAHSGMFIGFNFHSIETLKETMAEHEEISKYIMLGNVVESQKAIERHAHSTMHIYREGLNR